MSSSSAVAWWAAASPAAGGIRGQFPTETEIRFSLESIRAFERFEEESGVDPGYRKIGYLFLIAEADDLRGFQTRVAIQRRLGVDVRIIGPADAHALVPALRVDDLIAAVWGPDDGMAGPAEVTNGFARRARQLGARILEGVEVAAIERDGARVRGVRAAQGTVQAPVVVNAAGPAVARVARLAGVEVPVHPRRRIAGDWAGLRPLTPDEYAIIGWAPGVGGPSSPWGSAAMASSTPPRRAASSPSG